VAYFLVLQTTSQFLDARTQELQLVADLQRAHANLDRSVGRNLSQSRREEVVVPLEFPEDAQAPLPVEDVQQTDVDVEPNVLIISKDGSSLFSGDTTDERIGAKLRQIADELDAMSGETHLTNAARMSPVKVGGAITTGWRE
jgi:cobalt-zinc-cadmium efflux system outer membrane protein